MWKTRIIALFFIVLGVGLGGYTYQTEKNGKHPFKLGLDLRGGSYLVYKADVSSVSENEVKTSMDSLRDVIERRINAFGIAEPNVQTETHTLAGESEERLVIELPGVTNLDKAVEMIGQTPFLEFKMERPEEEKVLILAELEKLKTNLENPENQALDVDMSLVSQDPIYMSTDLTGKYLKKAMMQFTQSGAQVGVLQQSPYISLQFNNEGATLFKKMTEQNLNKRIAIYLDGMLVTDPVVETVIPDGRASITGTAYTIDEVKETVGRLNSGALPIPIELISTNTIGPTLGQDAVDAGVKAGIIGLILVGLVLILWYRLPGLIAVVALGVYTAIMLWIFKFLPVTLTSAGIAGFIISIGIAVDANILIFERMKEEINEGRDLYNATKIGFNRAWASIRDANISSILSAVILFWFGTALIKGFALTFGIGILVSMLTAIIVTRAMLMSFTKKDKNNESHLVRFLYQSGFNK